VSEITVSAGSGSPVSVSVSGGTAEVTVTQASGDRGPKGDTGPANSLTIGTVTTGAAGSTAVVAITGTAPSQVISFTIPRGDAGQQGAQGPAGATGASGSVGATGPAGPPNSLTIGSVVTLAAGSSVVATITGTSPNQILSLSIPRGEAGANGSAGATGATGPANSLTIGTVTTGVTASATITGTAPNQTLSLVLPKGDKGDTGAAGATGSAGATGPAGPANSLSIGTVTTGVTASATITGTAPSQSLSLVLPKGDKGDTGATGTFGTPQDINAVTSGYTLVIGDAGKLVTVNSSSSATLTVPVNSSVAFPVGTHIDIARLGAGAVTVDGDAGVAVNATPGRRLRAAYSTGTLIKLGTNTWLLVGDLAT